MYVYPLTDDNAFRKANPLINAKFNDSLSKINSVFDFNFKDTAGNAIAMRSFKAKYLVIDFWASWCKPCIANIPDIKQMSEEYKTDSIQFISISIDKDLNEWKESIRKHDFTGVQLSEPTGFHSLAAIYCKVLWVPTYIVADRNGHIIRYNAPQASEPELKLLLDNLINNGVSKHN
jgi:thiol-disulfide isomerase/thioredoxin